MVSSMRSGRETKINGGASNKQVVRLGYASLRMTFLAG
jgi:hypothetical protein